MPGIAPARRARAGVRCPSRRPASGSSSQKDKRELASTAMRNSSVWDMLEVRHLRAFTEVARHGSFGAAARELGYTQSGVSQQIQGLERIVGAPILRRQPGGRRPVELTDAGRLLLGHAEHLLARVGATRADLAALASGEAGTVAVITIQSVGTRI